ncbi:MAG: D-glycero-beta-D-manno-heptose 1,7-bisphosphate 7-phosphatase [Gammaproteobacteria bacterium]|nr:D-glycero-beta-D-manno-heptose 1,7-bisphosphate 7-phosphatase [Gammaproteobacteria bacterium]
MPTDSNVIILDRDGVINEDSDNFIKSPEEFIPIKGSLTAIARLKQANYCVVLATNQSGVGRGLFDIDMLNRIHEKLHKELANLGVAIDGIFFCPHNPDDECDCRKPKPGMFYDISQRLKVELSSVISIGDSLRDIQAANIAGAIPVLVKTGKGKLTIKKNVGLENVPVYKNLSAVVDDILSGNFATRLSPP